MYILTRCEEVENNEIKRHHTSLKKPVNNVFFSMSYGKKINQINQAMDINA